MLLIYLAQNSWFCGQVSHTHYFAVPLFRKQGFPTPWIRPACVLSTVVLRSSIVWVLEPGPSKACSSSFSLLKCLGMVWNLYEWKNMDHESSWFWWGNLSKVTKSAADRIKFLTQSYLPLKLNNDCFFLFNHTSSSGSFSSGPFFYPQLNSRSVGNPMQLIE